MAIIKRAVNHQKNSTGHYVRGLKQIPNSSRRQARCPDRSTFKFISKDNSYIVKAKRREDNSSQRWKGSLHFFSHETQQNCHSMCGIQSNENKQGHAALSEKRRSKPRTKHHLFQSLKNLLLISHRTSDSS